MKKLKIAILGSTGSIGISTLEIIKNDKLSFSIELLTANNNYLKLIDQAKIFKVKNVLIKNKKFYEKVKYSLKNSNTKVFYGNTPINKILKKKIDCTVSSIVGIAGLQPTLEVMKLSRKVAIANKEAIICGWPILLKYKKKYKNEIIPIDSEHFSILELTKECKDNEIEEIVITASGGPFLKTPLNRFKKIKPAQAIKHPNWKMGKKISIDSANLMNKIFEVIEASKIFDFNKKKYKIIIHPQSYIHSIIRFRNGLIKMILYNTDMKIPISNILYEGNNIFPKTKNIDIKTLNSLNFKKVDKKKFPSIKLLDKCLNSGPSAPTIANASNEVLVDMFLKGKIRFIDIVATINKIFKDKEFKKYAKKKAETIKIIKTIDNWARLKTKDLCVR
jgi:1-deoxy-D-xylulose-5-phosphate reductoisomerase